MTERSAGLKNAVGEVPGDLASGCTSTQTHRHRGADQRATQGRVVD
jgi:hypothetical protein